MARPQHAMNEINVQAAAYLYGEHRWTQGEIGGLLGGLSQPLVSRLLRRAEERGWLERSYRFAGADRLPPERMEYLSRLIEPKGLLEALKSVESTTGIRVRDVRVVDSGRAAPIPGTAQRRRFGRTAAGRVRELFERSDVFALTWGSTVSHVVDGIAASRPLPLTGRIRFVPVCAEPTEESSNKDTSSHLVQRLHGLLQPNTPPPPSLAGVAALIPRRFSSAQARVIRKFVQQAGSYQEIFGKDSPLIDAVDSLLTSVGPSSQPMGFVLKELLRAGSTPSKKLTAARLATLVVGDIGGVLLPRRGLGAQDRWEVEQLNAMWTGVKLKHLERIAREADRTRRPGVIVVSLGGEGRAEVIAEAVRCGLVNELIADRQLANKLVQVLSAKGPGSAPTLG